jgi:hypothetical protein
MGYQPLDLIYDISFREAQGEAGIPKGPVYDLDRLI